VPGDNFFFFFFFLFAAAAGTGAGAGGMAADGSLRGGSHRPVT
jgi:hypothetical protein